jgi:hypothetical protein
MGTAANDCPCGDGVRDSLKRMVRFVCIKTGRASEADKVTGSGHVASHKCDGPDTNAMHVLLRPRYSLEAVNEAMRFNMSGTTGSTADVIEVGVP